MKTLFLSVITALALLSTSLASDPIRYAAFLQADASPGTGVNVTVLWNQLGVDLDWEKTAEGEYRGICDAVVFPVGAVAPFSYENQAQTIYAEVHELDEKRIIVKQFHGRYGASESGPVIYFEINVGSE